MIIENATDAEIASRYYITAAPQCVYPDGALGGVLNTANFDAIYGESPDVMFLVMAF